MDQGQLILKYSEAIVSLEYDIEMCLKFIKYIEDIICKFFNSCKDMRGFIHYFYYCLQRKTAKQNDKSINKINLQLMNFYASEKNV